MVNVGMKTNLQEPNKNTVMKMIMEKKNAQNPRHTLDIKNTILFSSIYLIYL